MIPALALLFSACGGGERAPEAEPPSEAREEALASLGYASGVSPAPEETGVTTLDAEAVASGLRLYTSGHAPVAILMDVRGRVLHEWSASYLEVWPGRRAVHRAGDSPEYWRRARLLPGGDLLVIFEGSGLACLDRDSNVRWARHDHAHHDVAVARDGSVWVLERRARMMPGVSGERATVEDLVTILEPDGRPRRTVSLLECFEASPDHAWRPALDAFLAGPAARVLEPRPQDVFHTNSVHPLAADGGPGPPGPDRALVSIRHLNTILVADLTASRVTWSLTGATTAQHDARPGPGGTLTAFDNLWRSDRSRVVEIDPAAGTVVWEYHGGEEAPFFSRESGGASTLPNGNVLVAVTDAGLAFEVTRDGRRVWEFVNPHRTGDEGELVASVFCVERVPDEAVAGWLER